MPTLINASSKPLSLVFDKSYAFEIPVYQRPYSWELEQAELLLQDLLDFQAVKKDDGYFLGSIVLIKDDQNVKAEVIDGQQRLTTLTILIACLAERARELGDPDFSTYVEYLYEKGNKLTKTPEQPRLTLREKDGVFFSTWVQGLQIDAMLQLDPVQLATDAQRHILNNTGYLRAETIKTFPDLTSLEAFATFLMSECYLVVVSTPTQDSAFRVFSTMNSRGLDLSTPDILKAKILGSVADAEKLAFSAVWEDLEEGLGRVEFDNLFGHIRTIFRPEKQRGTLLKEFEDYVLSGNKDGKKLIENVISPYALAYENVIDQSFKATAGAEKANEALTWLAHIDHRDWVPAALEVIVRHGSNGDMVATLLVELERLAAYLFICHVGASQRIARYARVVSDLRANSTKALQISETETQEMVARLDANIYELSPKRKNYIIRRLDRFMSDGGATYSHKMFTIEHVMPQTISDDSTWAEWWPDVEKRKLWTHRLANLVALNQYRNSTAGNRNLDKKIETYLAGRKGNPSYTLTVKMLKATSWKEDDLVARQADLIETMIEGWGLTMPATAIRQAASV